MTRRLAIWTSRAILAGGWAVAGAWLLGMATNDRWLWSQFLWWLPTPVAATGVAGATGLSWLLWLGARGGRSPQERARDRRALAVSWSVAGALTLLFIFMEARIYRAILPAPDAPDHPLRLLTWNINTARIEDVPARVAPLHPDVFLMANRPYFGSFGDLRATVGEHTSVAAGGRLAVISRYPVIAYTHVPLEVTGADPRTHRWPGGGMVSIDRGEALLVLLDTKEWNGSTVCLWLVDMPSDPPIPRSTMMQQARSAIEGFTGPAYLPRQNAADQPVPAAEDLRRALLTPDIISGDCNTPRHSWSISRVLAPGMRYAPDLAGYGWRTTFPAGWAALAIDNTLLSDRLACSFYDVYELSTRPRDHLAQLTVIAPAPDR